MLTLAEQLRHKPFPKVAQALRDRTSAILDWSMPGVSGQTVVRSIRDNWPEARAIVFSAYSNPAVVDAACEAGAWGFVSKTDGFDALIDAIFNVADGKMVIRC